jgi:RNA polymerase sigma factor (sigma-70 family)
MSRSRARHIAVSNGKAARGMIMQDRFFRRDRVSGADRHSGLVSRSDDVSARFTRAMLPHIDAAYNLARYLSGDPSAAEDIVQDALLRAFRGFGTWRGAGAKAWLLAIVRTCFLSQLNATGPSTNDIHEWISELPPELIVNENPESLLAEKREVSLLRASVETLAQPFRETLILRDLEELSYKEIAVITEVSIGTVMSRLSRARHMLADRSLPEVACKRECDAVSP